MAIDDVAETIEQGCTPLGLFGLRVLHDPIDRKRVYEDALRAGASNPEIDALAVRAELLARGWSSTDALTIASWYQSGQKARQNAPGNRTAHHPGAVPSHSRLPRLPGR